MAHLGNRVSALLDGRLPPAEEERLWDHVHDCHPCRDLVEREGWVKTSLATLAWDGATVPDRLKQSLLGGAATLPSTCPIAAARPRSRSMVAIGGGALGAAVVGLLALGATTTPRVDPRPPVSELGGSSDSATPVVDQRPRRRQDATPPAVPWTQPGLSGALAEVVLAARETMSR